MTDGDGPIIHGLPDGGAELSVVLRLRWDDVAALGREASRLAEQRGAPVSLDEAASHRLRTWSAVAKSPDEKAHAAQGAPAAAPSAPTAAAISAAPAGDRSRVQVGPMSESARVASIAPPAARQVQTAPAGAGQPPA
ncbi:hypothetical protein V1460_23700 [Streptomyces sp. SCSIO 30461]|uniref:hypothetical protein n=1 Tax=Streptomyces sp. SCSIO 30461 TaxID=3118085 RepID=UPI0030D201F5